jgi:eukaryotic-like serine/threonine-protein kinase
VIGTRINNYEIVSLIGEGGMGNVYLARHPMIDRGAAIKVLHPELAADSTLVTRFFNEARAANAIRHPNIIDIIDVGMLPGSERPYLMMELLQGENLARRIARLGQLPVAQAIEVARQTASALAAAHAKGIIHRDLKPENLYLVPHGSLPGRELVKVLDFGIAKLRSEVGNGQVQTRTGMLMGTPPYMSPEQCRGLSAEIDLRTDVYALGIILFEMVCGGPPFTAAGFGDLLVMHIMQPPPSPRTRNPAVPEALEAIILKALAKAAGERFATMMELEAALAAVPAGGTTAAAAATAPREASKPAGSATTTFRATSGEVSSDLESLDLPRSRRPLLLAAVGLAGLGAVGLWGLRGRLERSAGAGSAQPTALSTKVKAPVPPPVVQKAPARPVVVAPPDAGAPPARSTRKSGTRPSGERSRGGPEKW